jgi:cellulose synthase/poly-beta-1,6-N-acetylglucosamine synthase-like glycosyltransferase
MAHLLIWSSLAFLLYVHFGYPLLLDLWRRVAARPVKKGFWEPTVSILIAVHNEKDTIEAKLLNCLQLDYPDEKLQIVVALDAPTDGTDAIVAGFHGISSEMVSVVKLAQHKGKAGALNHALMTARGEILVFADARQSFEHSALRELVANFHDPEVGCASGELILLDENDREASDGMGIYWRYEKWMRAQESEIHSMLGATGAIYAIRRELYKPMRPDTILDDMAVPLSIVLGGQRAVFDGAAHAFDRVSASPEIEYGRKVRTLMGNFQLLARMPALLSPFHNPVWLQFMSHKVARLLVPYALVILFVANMFAHGAYVWLFAAQCAWYFLAGLGSLLSRWSPLREVGPASIAVASTKREGS